MVAIVILFISMMAILQALGMSVQSNMQNLMMDEAVRIANDQMNVLRNDNTVASLMTNSTGVTVPRTFRNVTISYSVTWNVENLSANNSRAIQVVVKWVWQNMRHQHATSSIVSQNI